VIWPEMPTYPFAPPPELSGAARRHKVAIVGAGPVGLTLALELDRHGIECVVVEPRDRASEGSRATCVARRSMDILDGLGVGEAYRRKGLGWTRGKSFYRNELVYELEMPFPPYERHYPMYNMQQCHMEQLLIDAALERPRIELRWASRVTSVRLDAQGVTCRVETPEGEYDLDADYVAACDGARSPMREMLGLKLSGSSASGRYVIADIEMRSDYPTQRRAWFDPPCNPGSTVLMHKQPDDIWRVDFQVIDDAVFDEKRVLSSIQQILDMAGEKAPWRLVWRSEYRAHALAIDDYRVGRIFFAGDAAHLVPIFGVRGLNSGFADANNLGWKLASVLRGNAPDALLDTYNLERRAATMDIHRESWKSTVFMTPPTDGMRLMRDAALSLAVDSDVTRCLVNPRQSTPYDYVESPLTTRDDAAPWPRAGAALPNVRLGDDDFLHRHLPAGFSLLCFPEDAARLHQTVHVVPLLHRVAEPLNACAGEVLIIRPDAHLCARLVGPTAEEVIASVGRALGKEPPTSAPPRREAETQPNDATARTEAVFALVSEAIDKTPPGERDVLLAQLVYLLADKIGDTAEVARLVEKTLPPPRGWEEIDPM
jgi:3-(3-hydroxy-phenyl)propionate hydroxylase